jgi:hypothetical protein
MIQPSYPQPNIAAIPAIMIEAITLAALVRFCP